MEKEKQYEAGMIIGDSIMWLPVTKDDENIYFIRDENHVHAWHCNSLPINHYDIKEIREKI